MLNKNVNPLNLKLLLKFEKLKHIVNVSKLSAPFFKHYCKDELNSSETSWTKDIKK